MRRNKHLLAFTLLEVLLALLMFSIVIVGLYSVLRNGIKSWTFYNSKSDENADLREFFRIFRKDAQNILNYEEDLPFIGKTNEVIFVTLSTSPLGARVVRIIYRFDPAKNIVTRLVATQDEGLDVKAAKTDGQFDLG